MRYLVTIAGAFGRFDSDLIVILSTINRIRRNGSGAINRIKDTIVQSKIANFLYYRAWGFFRATFIYDLMVSPDHVVFRGVAEFLILLPFRIVSNIWVFLKWVGAAAVNFYRAVSSIWSVTVYPTVRYYGWKWFFAFLVSTNTAPYVWRIYGDFIYFINFDQIDTWKQWRAFWSGIRVELMGVWVRYTYVFVTGLARIAVFRDAVISALAPQSIVDYIVCIFIVPLWAVAFVLGLWPFWFVYKLFLGFKFVFLKIGRLVRSVFAAGVAAVRTVIIYTIRILKAVYKSAAVQQTILKFDESARTNTHLRHFIGFWGRSRRSARNVTHICSQFFIFTTFYLPTGRSAVGMVGGGLRTRIFIILFSAFSFYYLFIFEWMLFFDNYLLLRAINAYGVSRAWSADIIHRVPVEDYVQYETGDQVHDYAHTWFTHLSTVIARTQYFYGMVDTVFGSLVHHTEFFYLVFALVCWVWHLVDSARFYGTFCVLIVRILSAVVFFTHLSPLLPGQYNAITQDTLFVEMYISGWWEAVAGCVASSTWLFVFTKSQINRFLLERCEYITLFVFSVLAYTIASIPFCNDFISLFLTVELFSWGALALVLLTCASPVGSVVRYLVFSISGSFFWLWGLAVAYGVAGASSFLRIVTELFNIPYSIQLSTVIFIAGVLVKLLSVPLLSVFQITYSSMQLGFISVVALSTEVAYAALVFKLFSFMQLTAAVSATTYIPVISLLGILVLVAAVASLRAANTISGWLYSSVQHIGLIWVSVIVSRYVWFGVTASMGYYVFYSVITILFIALCAMLEGGVFGTWAVALLRAVLCFTVLSLIGIPPFTGFYFKMFILVPLLEAQLWFATTAIIISTLISFVFYGRILCRSWLLLISEYTAAKNSWSGWSLTAVLTATTAHLFTPALLIAVSLVFILSFLFIGSITQILSFLSVRLISPVFRSTEHRNSFIITALTTALDDHPNTHLFYSWGSLYWFLPLWHYMSWGLKYHQHYMSFASPNEPHTIPKFDSRYFWIGEWLMYPWWIATPVTGRREVGPTFEHYFQPWVPRIRGWLYWATTSRGLFSRYESDYPQRVALWKEILWRPWYPKGAISDWTSRVEEDYDMPYNKKHFRTGSSEDYDRSGMRFVAGRHRGYWSRVLDNIGSIPF